MGYKASIHSNPIHVNNYRITTLENNLSHYTQNAPLISEVICPLCARPQAMVSALLKVSKEMNETKYYTTQIACRSLWHLVIRKLKWRTIHIKRKGYKSITASNYRLWYILLSWLHIAHHNDCMLWLTTLSNTTQNIKFHINAYLLKKMKSSLTGVQNT